MPQREDELDQVAQGAGHDILRQRIGPAGIREPARAASWHGRRTAAPLPAAPPHASWPADELSVALSFSSVSHHTSLTASYEGSIALPRLAIQPATAGSPSNVTDCTYLRTPSTSPKLAINGPYFRTRCSWNSLRSCLTCAAAQTPIGSSCSPFHAPQRSGWDQGLRSELCEAEQHQPTIIDPSNAPGIVVSAHHRAPQTESAKDTR